MNTKSAVAHLSSGAYAGPSIAMIAVLALGLLAGCSGIRLVSDYDPVTDQSLSALQQKTDDYIQKLKTEAGQPAGGYANNMAFYDGVDRDLRALEFRVNAIPNNAQTKLLVADIRKVILGDGKCSPDGTSLRDLQCMPGATGKGPSAAVLDVEERTISQTIAQALAKKQGLQ